MRSWWLIGLFALNACDDHQDPNPFRYPPTLSAGGSSAGGSTLTPPTLPIQRWNWQACGTIPRVVDEPVLAIPLAGDVTALGYASGAWRLYRDAEPPVVLREPGLGLGEAQFSPDGKLLAELAGGTLRLRSTADGSVVRDVSVQNPPCGDRLMFAPDGKHLVLSALPATCVIDVESGAVVTRVEGAYGPAFYANGRLVAGSDFSTLTTFDATGQVVATTPIPVEAEPQLSSFLSPKADRLARQLHDGSFVLYDLANGQVVTSFPTTGNAFNGAAFSADGELLLMGDRVLATANGKIVTQLTWLPGKPARAALSNDGRRATFWGGEGDEHHPTLIDLETHHALRAFGGHSSSVVGISASPDGKRFVTTSGQSLLGWRIAEPFEASFPEWSGDAGQELYAQYSPDGAFVAVSGVGRALFAADGPRVFVPPPTLPKSCPNAHFAFSKDGRWLAGSGGDFLVDVFDTSTLEVVARLPSSSCNSTADFSADGAFLLTGAVEIYRTQDWSRVTPDHVAPLQSTSDDAAFNDAVFMPNGRELLVSRCVSGPGVYGNCAHELWTAGGRPKDIALPIQGIRPDFSPEGDWLVAANVVLALGGQLSRQLALNLVSAAFLPNGDIIGAGADGAITRFCRSE